MTKTKIASLRHKIILCRQEDVVISEEGLRLNRDAVATLWAGIDPVRPSAFSPNGATMREGKAIRTHMIFTRYRWDLNVSVMAWIYEARLRSVPRWFKIVSVSHSEDKGNSLWSFYVRLIERGDEISQPSSGLVTGLPEGVRL